MSKALLFDMDGTIVDLYSVEDWLVKLRNEDASPYRDAMPMYDMDTLKAILDVFRNIGYRIVVVSWGSMGGSREYTREVKKVKREWLDRHNFPYDEIHVIKYGTPKQNFIKSDIAVLVDDNAEVRTDFMKSNRGSEKYVIDASRNIIEQLVNLLVG